MSVGSLEELAESADNGVVLVRRSLNAAPYLAVEAVHLQALSFLSHKSRVPFVRELDPFSLLVLQISAVYTLCARVTAVSTPLI